VVEAGFRQAAVAGAAGAVAGGLVHGALDAGAAGVVSLEGDSSLRGAGGGLGFGQVAGRHGELPSFLAAGLDVTGLSLLDGAKIQLWACSGGLNQQWLVGPNGELINVNSSRCLDDTGGSTVNGTQLDQQDCYGSVPEVWAAT
jgi:Ricin-type beta-trefoil lectin domain